MDIGGRRFAGQDVEYMQENVRELTALLAELIGGSDGSAPTVLKGVQFTDTGITITATAGWIFWQGELYEFVPPPAPIGQTGLVNVKLYRTFQSDAELPYVDIGTPVMIQKKNFISLEAASWVDANIAVDDRILVSSLALGGLQPWIEVAVAGAAIPGSTWTVFDSDFKYRKNGNRIEFSGSVNGFFATSSTIYTLPIGFWPIISQPIYVNGQTLQVSTIGQIGLTSAVVPGLETPILLTNTSFNLN